MHITPDFNIPVASTHVITQTATSVTQNVPSEANKLIRNCAIKKNVIPTEAIRPITLAIASNNETKINKILNEYSLDALAKLKVNFTTENNTDYKNINLFFLACRSGCIKIVQELINNENININEPAYCENGINNQTALIIASAAHIEIVKLLLEHNANIEIKDDSCFDAIQYSVVTGSANIDRCYEIQKLLHNHKQKLNLTTNCYNLATRITLGYGGIYLFNNNQDFLITYFHMDDNKNISDITYRSSNAFIQCFLDAFKPYLIHDFNKPVFNNIQAILEKLNKNNDVSLDYHRLETDPNITESLNATVSRHHDGEPEVIDNLSINFQNQLYHYNDQMSLIDSIMPVVAVFYNKKLSDINRVDLITMVYELVLDFIIKDFSELKDSFPEYSNNLPISLADVAEFSEEQQLELINKLIYISVVLSFSNLKNIPKVLVSKWK